MVQSLPFIFYLECVFPELRLSNQTQFTWGFKKNRFEEANIYLLQQDA